MNGSNLNESSSISCGEAALLDDKCSLESGDELVEDVT